MGIDVDERPISVNELVDSHKNGALKEIFGTGTAVTILPINGFGFRENKYKLENIPSSYSNSFEENSPVKFNSVKHPISLIGNLKSIKKFLKLGLK